MARLPAPKLSNYHLWRDLAVWTHSNTAPGQDWRPGVGNEERQCEQVEHMPFNAVETLALSKLNDLR